MSDPMEAIKQTYFQECEELLLAMEEGLLALENGEADSEAINAVFRAVHSIKGSGGAFGFEELVHFAHGFETVLDHLRSGKLEAGGEVVKVLLRAGDMLADHVAAARNGVKIADGVDQDIASELAALSGEEGADDEGEAPADFEGLDFAPMLIDVEAVPAADQGTGWRIAFAPHATLYANANEPALLIRELGRLGEITVTADLSRLPALADMDAGAAYFAWHIELRGEAPRPAVEEVFDFVTGHCDLEIASLSPASLSSAPPLPELPPLPQADAPPAAERKDVPAADTPKQSIRVDLEKVDRLVNLVGELVITQAMLSQRVTECRIPRASPVGNGLAELEHLLRELQESVMAIRTQPVKSVFQRMPRLVRELAAQTEKKVRLVVEGETTEVDKTVIERLGEPLTHMIRNAVDHGLEAPQERLAAGKPEEGTVTLSAEHRGGRIVIEVCDDGRGIDRARVREKAVERGLIAPNAMLSDEETDNLIFMPGFSTAKEISNISGRGVGMDVVRRNIIDLGGRIVIGSTPKRGSRFSLTLPLTLAVLDGMVVAIGDQTFVLPLTHIVESLKPKLSDIHAFGRGRSLLNVRGAYVPLVMTAEILDAKGAVGPEQGVVILVESQGTGRLALAVDAILGQRQVVIKSFEDNYQHIDGIAAATILGDGRVALILDVDGIVTRCRNALGGDINELRPTGS
jgi:two-component system chemotaxis sensor kinase CheA